MFSLFVSPGFVIPTVNEAHAMRDDEHGMLKLGRDVSEWLDRLDAVLTEPPCPNTLSEGESAYSFLGSRFDDIKTRYWRATHEWYLSGRRYGTVDRELHNSLIDRVSAMARRIEVNRLAFAAARSGHLHNSPRSRWAWAGGMSEVEHRVRREYRGEVRRAIATFALRWTHNQEPLMVTVFKYPYGPTLSGKYTTVWTVRTIQPPRQQWHDKTVAVQYTLDPAMARRLIRLLPHVQEAALASALSDCCTAKAI